MDLSELIRNAISDHQLGELDSAIGKYQAYLDQMPEDANVIHLLGVANYQAQRFEEGERQLLRAIQLDDSDPSYYSNLGLVQRALGKPDEAAASYQHAIALEPSYADPYVNFGKLLQNAGRHQEAAELLERGIENCISNASLWNNLAVCQRAIGDEPAAEKSWERALQIDPNHWDSLSNLALWRLANQDPRAAAYIFQRMLQLPNADVETLKRCVSAFEASDEVDQLEEVLTEWIQQRPTDGVAIAMLGMFFQRRGEKESALETFEHAVQFAPDYAELRNDLGVLYHDMGNDSKAREHLLAAIELNAGFRDAHFNLAIVMQRVGDIELAVFHYRMAVAIDEYFGKAYRALAVLFYGLGEYEQMKEVLEQQRKSLPDDPEVQHLLASISQDDVPVKASEEYVRYLFDGFTDYDHQLGKIEYQGPSILAKTLGRLAPPVDQLVLDGGCGTGLCADALRPYAAYLAGIDLSEKMLESAQRTGQYDSLDQRELVEYLSATPSRWGIIAMMDTLVYFGELEQVFAALAGSLKTEGIAIMTTESFDGSSYRLTPSGRYQHSKSYIEEVAGHVSLEIMLLEDAPLRIELGDVVMGHVTCLRKPAVH